MSKYLHTINGEPAVFDGWQICFASFHGKPNKLADSLAQIKKEQKVSTDNRASKGFKTVLGEYGYFRYN